MLPRQLDNWLQQGDATCLSQLQGFMFMGELKGKDVAHSKSLLAALKRAAGRTGKYNTFLPLRYIVVGTTHPQLIQHFCDHPDSVPFMTHCCVLSALLDWCKALSQGSDVPLCGTGEQIETRSCVRCQAAFCRYPVP